MGFSNFINYNSNISLRMDWIGLLTRFVRDKCLVSSDLRNNLPCYKLQRHNTLPRPIIGSRDDCRNKTGVINLIITLLSIQNCFVWPEKINTITGQPHCLPPLNIPRLLLVCSAAQTNCLRHHTFPPGVRSEEWRGKIIQKIKQKPSQFSVPAIRDRPNMAFCLWLFV